MKILTVVEFDPTAFDKQVNDALEKGYILGRRDLMVPNTGTAAHYAQLVLLDPVPEPDGAEAIEALRTVRAACLAHEGSCNNCPMDEWCERLAQGGDPTDWILPGEVHA